MQTETGIPVCSNRSREDFSLLLLEQTGIPVKYTMEESSNYREGQRAMPQEEDDGVAHLSVNSSEQEKRA